MPLDRDVTERATILLDVTKFSHTLYSISHFIQSDDGDFDKQKQYFFHRWGGLWKP